jgi:hypothetical protein
MLNFLPPQHNPSKPLTITLPSPLPTLLPCLQLIFTTTSGHSLGTFRVVNFVCPPCNKCTESWHTQVLSLLFLSSSLTNTEQRNRQKLRPYVLILWTKNKNSTKLKRLGKNTMYILCIHVYLHMHEHAVICYSLEALQSTTVSEASTAKPNVIYIYHTAEVHSM